MKENYTIKDLLFGTSQESLEIEKKLARLKELTDTNDKQVADFFFRLRLISNCCTISQDPAVCCNFIQNSSTFKGQMINLAQKLNLYYAKRMSVECPKEINQGENILTINDYKAFVKSGYEEEFSTIIKQILSTDYAKFMRAFSDFYQEKKTNTNVSLIFWGHMVQIANYIPLTSKVSSEVKLIYTSQTGTIEAEQCGSILNDEKIVRVLGLHVPAKNMSEYHRNLIDNSGVQKKPLQIVSETEDASKLLLKIEETPDKIILRKKKYIQ